MTKFGQQRSTNYVVHQRILLAEQKKCNPDQFWTIGTRFGKIRSTAVCNFVVHQLQHQTRRNWHLDQILTNKIPIIDWTTDTDENWTRRTRMSRLELEFILLITTSREMLVQKTINTKFQNYTKNIIKELVILN